MGLRRGAFTCVGWQVTLCDPIWQMTPRSSRTSSRRGLYSALALTLTAGHRPHYMRYRPIAYSKIPRNIEVTRSTQRAQTSAERQHNRIDEWFLQCKLAMQLWSESTRYFFDNPVNPDFGLRTPRSGRWSGSTPKFNHLVPTPSRNFRQNPFTTFSVIRRTDKQTNRQTEVKT